MAAGQSPDYPDTMDQRYGAWAQLLTLFRLVYEGGRHGEFHVPPRHGYLFDPDRYNFLEGRSWKTSRHLAEKTDVPQVPDGVVFRVLRNLLVLDGERLSYRTLDVEQIGSVYETMMGFSLEVAQGRSIAVKPAKAHGAPTTINLEALLACKPAQRAKWLQDHAEQKITGQAATALKEAESIEDLLAALERKLARGATPNVAPGRDGPPAQRRAAPQRVALHAPVAHRADCPEGAGAGAETFGWHWRVASAVGKHGQDARATHPRPNPRSENLRPGHGLRGVAGRSVPAVGRRAGQGVARSQVPAQAAAGRGRSVARPATRGAAVPVRGR